MTFSNGENIIRVEQIKEFGKYPSLWVGTENELVKVASFGSFEKSEMFCAQIAKVFFNVGETEMKILGLSEYD